MREEKTVAIGVIGCGSMGAELAGAVGRSGPGGIPGARVTALLDIDAERGGVLAQSLDPHPASFTDESDFLASEALDIVAECASQIAVREHGEAVLRSGRSLLLEAVRPTISTVAYMARFSSIVSATGPPTVSNTKSVVPPPPPPRPPLSSKSAMHLQLYPCVVI